MIYLPGTGILDSYTDSATGALNDQFDQALAMYVWAWFILTVLYTIAAMRSSWVLFLNLIFLDIDLILLACGYMTGMKSLLTAGNAFGLVVAFMSCEFPLKFSIISKWFADVSNQRLGWRRWFVGKRHHPNPIADLSNVQRPLREKPTPMLRLTFLWLFCHRVDGF